MTGTTFRFCGGGPEDGHSRFIPDGIHVVCFPRLLIERDKRTGEMKFYEDAKFIHAYVRMDDGYMVVQGAPVKISDSAFAYDGIRAIEKGTPAQLLVLSRSS